MYMTLYVVKFLPIIPTYMQKLPIVCTREREKKNKYHVSVCRLTMTFTRTNKEGECLVISLSSGNPIHNAWLQQIVMETL